MVVYLSTIPRSGSTLLTALLNQRPDTYASPTNDDLCDAVMASDDIRTDIDNWYDTDKLVFDKSRKWAVPSVIEKLLKAGDVKIVSTVRPMNECLASFVRLMCPYNVEDFCHHSTAAQHLMGSYSAVHDGYKRYPENFLLIQYDDLVAHPQGQLDRIADFVGLPRFTHNLLNVQSNEDEDAWGIRGLHKVRKKISKQLYSAKDTLGAEMYNFYQGGEFWNKAK
jgi:sulfotransferase